MIVADTLMQVPSNFDVKKKKKKKKKYMLVSNSSLQSDNGLRSLDETSE